MSQTPESRIRAHYRALRTRHNDPSRGYRSRSEIIMVLAQHWRRPCAEIREILGPSGPHYTPPSLMNQLLATRIRDGWDNIHLRPGPLQGFPPW